jgi:hypothetical protein
MIYSILRAVQHFTGRACSRAWARKKYILESMVNSSRIVLSFMQLSRD